MKKSLSKYVNKYFIFEVSLNDPGYVLSATFNRWDDAIEFTASVSLHPDCPPTLVVSY